MSKLIAPDNSHLCAFGQVMLKVLNNPGQPFSLTLFHEENPGKHRYFSLVADIVGQRPEIEGTEQELAELGRALLHVINHPRTAFDVVMVDRDNPALRHSFTVVARELKGKEAPSHERH
jgi:hypothetical protein